MLETSTIQEQKLNNLIKGAVFEAMQDFLFDKDYGLELKQSFVKKMQKSIASKKSGKVKPLETILQQYQK